MHTGCMREYAMLVRPATSCFTCVLTSRRTTKAFLQQMFAKQAPRGLLRPCAVWRMLHPGLLCRDAAWQ